MPRTFVIADIHGCARTFSVLVEKLIGLNKSDRLYLLGDYIDRGPNSKGVLDYIIELQQKGYQIFALRGNHEEMLLRSYKSSEYLDTWLLNGGGPTLESFDASSIYDIPEVYIGFLKNLPFYFITDSHILVHAGLNFGFHDILEDQEAMLWLRNFVVDIQRTEGRGVIHGHTPISLIKIQEDIRNYASVHRINLDNGCVFGKHDLFGHLCALELENLKIYCQPNVEKSI